MKDIENADARAHIVRVNGTNASGGVNGGIPTNGVTTANGTEPQMIKANKGMILRKVGILAPVSASLPTWMFFYFK